MNKSKRNLFTCYTLLFAIVIGIVTIFFVNKSLTLVRNGDAYTQHYPAFLYIGKYYRTLIYNVLHHLPIKTWDFSIGYGSDVITTLSYYGLTDWTTVIFAVFSNENNGALLYSIMEVFRLFLSGAAFCLFCYRFNCSRYGTLIAVFAYVFCPYILENVVNGHHFFALPLLYFPLLLMGIEKIMDDESPLLFIITVAFSALSSFYFFYMEVIFAVIYYCVRFLSKAYPRISWKGFFSKGIGTAFYGLLGVFISMPGLLPFIFALSSNVRVNAKPDIQLLYAWNQYKVMLGNFVSSNSFSYYSFIGVSPAIMLGVLKKPEKSKKWVKYLWLISLLFLLIPFFGYLMNGFSYVANRFVWIYIFFTAFIFAYFFEDLLTASAFENKNTGIVIVLYFILVFVYGNGNSNEIVICFILLTLAYLLNILKFKRIIAVLGLALFTLAGIAVHTYFIFSPNERKGINSFFTVKQLNEKYDKDYLDAFSIIGDDVLCRVDTQGISRKPSTIISNIGLGTTYMYWSFINPNIIDYLQTMGVMKNTSYDICDLDNRLCLRSLLSAKYVVSKDVLNEMAGYKALGEVDNKTVYLNQLYLPIACWYENCVNESAFRDFSYGMKQEAMLSRCVVNDLIFQKYVMPNSNNDLLYNKLKVSDYLLNYDKNKITIDGNTILVKEKNANIFIDTDIPADSELYLEVYGLKYISDFGDNPDYVYLRAKCEDQYANAGYYFLPHYRYYWGNKDFCFNLGYSENDRKKIEVFFSDTGEYSLDRIILEYKNRSDYIDQITNLKHDGITDLAYEDNCISCNVENQTERILYFSIPFSEGWKMYVDDTESASFKANLIGLGAIIPAGSHSIKLVYHTPLLKEGFYLSFIGIVLAVYVCCKKEQFQCKVKRN